MLNPVALLGSSRFLQTIVTSKDHEEVEEMGSNYSEECCTITRSHQSTLDRLYAWEKKLFEEVKVTKFFSLTNKFHSGYYLSWQ